jgi:SagB-type dehydrogenase family enzyme
VNETAALEAAGPRFRRSRHVVAYWRDGAFILHNYATRAKTAAPAAVAEILGACEAWTSVDELCARAPGFARDVIGPAVTSLHEHGLLQREGDEPCRAEALMSQLDRWNPTAGFFHAATRDVTFTDADTARELQARRAADTPWPGPVRRYPGALREPLPAPLDGGAFGATLRRRRTWRQFGAGHVSRQDLSTLLWLTAGIQFRASTGGQREFCYRTSPSGGALQPIEVYVAVQRVDDVQPGLYHYASDDHLLERVGQGSAPPDVSRYLPSQPWFEQAALVVFFAALMERSLWRYEYARAYRSLLIEAGHLCQTFCLTATHLRLAPFSTMALADRHIDEDLGLNGASESVLYAAGAGPRPGRRRMAPAPAHFRTPRLRPNRPAGSR